MFAFSAERLHQSFAASSAMPKWKATKRQKHIARISEQGNLICGAGPASGVSEAFVLPPDWNIEDAGSAHLRYRSPTGQYFNSLAAVQEYLT